MSTPDSSEIKAPGDYPSAATTSEPVDDNANKDVNPPQDPPEEENDTSTTSNAEDFREGKEPDYTTEPKRWSKSMFYAGRGGHSMLRLDELHNLTEHGNAYAGDTSDRELAHDILNRANLLAHPHAEELLEKFTDVFKAIENPRSWMNPNLRDDQKPETTANVG